MIVNGISGLNRMRNVNYLKITYKSSPKQIKLIYYQLGWCFLQHALQLIRSWQLFPWQSSLVRVSTVPKWSHSIVEECFQNTIACKTTCSANSIEVTSVLFQENFNSWLSIESWSLSIQGLRTPEPNLQVLLLVVRDELGHENWFARQYSCI